MPSALRCRGPQTGFEEVGRIGGSLRACRGLRLDRGLYGNTRHRPRIMAFAGTFPSLVGLLLPTRNSLACGRSNNRVQSLRVSPKFQQDAALFRYGQRECMVGAIIQPNDNLMSTERKPFQAQIKDILLR